MIFPAIHDPIQQFFNKTLLVTLINVARHKIALPPHRHVTERLSLEKP